MNIQMNDRTSESTFEWSQQNLQQHEILSRQGVVVEKTETGIRIIFPPANAASTTLLRTAMAIAVIYAVPVILSILFPTVRHAFQLTLSHWQIWVILAICGSAALMKLRPVWKLDRREELIEITTDSVRFTNFVNKAAKRMNTTFDRAAILEVKSANHSRDIIVLARDQAEHTLRGFDDPKATSALAHILREALKLS